MVSSGQLSLVLRNGPPLHQRPLHFLDQRVHHHGSDLTSVSLLQNAVLHSIYMLLAKPQAR